MTHPALPLLASLLAMLLFGAAEPHAAERDAAAKAAFRRDNPCPANDHSRGPCPGWQVDHIQPLCAGGQDHPDNMQWLTIDQHRIKTRQDRKRCASE